MKKIYVTFRSITLAQRGERTLRAGGVDCALIRTPKWMETRGCGYCLRLRPEAAERALGLLTQARVPFRKVYAQNGDGTLEELTP